MCLSAAAEPRCALAGRVQVPAVPPERLQAYLLRGLVHPTDESLGARASVARLSVH